jgi:hypothetical protein
VSEVQGRKRLRLEDMAQPGDFYWTGSEPSESPGRLMFKCPCGCDAMAGIIVKGEHAWQWNGDLDKPTTTPSILISGGCPNKWHGYLTDGVFRSC